MKHVRLILGLLAATCCCIWVGTADQGVPPTNAKGFLEEEVPLKVIATTPTDLMTTKEPLIFSGVETITVVFSRAVIALGSDFGEKDLPKEWVPFSITKPELARGRFRWVTSSIARWDPIGSWAPDLKVQLKWNRDLKTYAGIPLNITIPDVEIHTPPLTMFVHGVASEIAMNLTDDHWDASIGLPDDNLPELPPDGKIVVWFDFPVDLTSIGETIKIVQVQGDERKDTELQGNATTCTLGNSQGSKEAKCAAISIVNGAVERGIKYEAVFPEGWSYNEKAGELTKDISFHFYGLRDFRIPFKEFNRKEWPYNEVSGRILHLWLPHGLSSGTSVKDLKGAFSLTSKPNGKPEELPFELSLKDKGVVSLTGPINPVEQYKIHVNADADIRDGFGLPLKSTEAVFTTADLDDYIAKFQPYDTIAINPADEWDGKYPVVSRMKKEGYLFQAYSVSPHDINEALFLGFALHYNPSLLQPKDLEVSIPMSDDPELTNVDLAPLLEQGDIIHTSHRSSWFWGEWIEHNIIQSDYQVAHAVWTAKGYQKVILYLTYVSDGKPYSGAEIDVMRRQDKQYSYWGEQEKTLEPLYRLKTDSDGVVEFLVPNCYIADQGCQDYVYWVRKGETNNMFSGIVSHPEEYSLEVQGSLVLDRKLVEPGDEVKIGGFFTQRMKGVVTPYGASRYLTLQITPEIDSTNEIQVDIDREYGTFTEKLKIPKDADPGRYSIYMSVEDLYLEEDIVVGKPRVPTAQLTIITPPWVKPNSTFEVEVQASSLLGAFIADAEMTMEWNLDRSEKEFEKVVEVVKTNSTGGLSYSIDLGNLTESARVGDTVEISVTWIGPTRERIKESATLRVQRTNMAVEFEKSLDTDIPNIEFGAWVSVTRATEIGVLPLESFPVGLELLHIPDSVDISDENLMKAILSDPTNDDEVPVKLIKNCTALAGVPESEIKCRFDLPDFGHYAFRACAADPIEDVTVCSVDLMGKTLDDWHQNPVSAATTVNFYSLSEEIDPSTMEIQMWVDIAFEDSSLLAVWGNDEAFQKKIIAFPKKGIQEIKLDGNVCIGGCKVSLYLAVPQQNKNFAKDVPHSIFRRPAMPQEFLAEKSFTIANETVPFTLNVTMGISKSDANEVTPLPGIDSTNPKIEEPFVLLPGENATISFDIQKCPGDPMDPKAISCVELEDAENAQVLVVVVNKAYLELIANPLVDLAEELMTRIPSEVSLDVWPETNHWMSPDGYGIAKDAFLRRLEKDPWLSQYMLDWDQKVVTDFSKPDDYFLQQNIQEGTIGPIDNSVLPEVWEALGRVAHVYQPPLNGPSARSPSEKGSDETVEPKLRVQENFKVTPIFKMVKADMDGSGSVNLTAPDSLGTFVVRAYASTGLAQRGSFESEIIVRLPLSLTSSAPRFVRSGDDFEAGVVVTINKKEKEGVPVVVTLLSDPEKAKNIEYQPDDTSSKPIENCEDPSDLSCLVQLDQKTIKSDVDGQVEVRFKFKAVRIGKADLTIRADIAGASDALKVVIPVHEQQKAVQLATSFALKGQSEEPTTSIKSPPVSLKTFNLTQSRPKMTKAKAFELVNAGSRSKNIEKNEGHHGNRTAEFPVPNVGESDESDIEPTSDEHDNEPTEENTTPPAASVGYVSFIKKGVDLDGDELNEAVGSDIIPGVLDHTTYEKSPSLGRKLQQSIGVTSVPGGDFTEATSKNTIPPMKSENDSEGGDEKGNTYQRIATAKKVVKKPPIKWTFSSTNSEKTPADIPPIGQVGFLKPNAALFVGDHLDQKENAASLNNVSAVKSPSTHKLKPVASPISSTTVKTIDFQDSSSATNSSKTADGAHNEQNSGGQGFQESKKVPLGLYGIRGRSAENEEKSFMNVSRSPSDSLIEILHNTGANVEWEEGLKFPEAAPGSGSIDLLAGVGRFPSVLDGVEKAIHDWNPWYVDADSALANITTPFILQQYGADKPDSPQFSTFTKALDTFETGMDNLRKGILTWDECGLIYSDYGRCEWWMHSFSQNAEGVWIADQVMKNTNTTSHDTLKWGVDNLQHLSKIWQKAMIEDLRWTGKDYAKKGWHLGIYYAINVRFVLGADWTPPDDFPEQIKQDLSMKRVSEMLQADKLSMGDRARVALIWLKKLGKVEGAKHADVVAAIKSFRDAFRTIGRTAYVSWNPTTAAPVGLRDQALILLAFVHSGESGPLIEKHANYVASPSRWYSPIRTFIRNLALTDYDKSTGSTDPDLDFSARSGNITLLQGNFTDPSDPMLSNKTSFETLSDPPKPLMFKVEGEGEATIVATLDFVPANLLPFPSYRGIFVERIIQEADVDGNPTGPGLKTVPLGKPVVLTIQATSPDELGSVSVEVMMPGGLEPIDPLVESDSDAQTTCTMGRLGIEISWWWWDFCPSQSTQPEKVTFHYNALYAGTSTIQFQAIAASVGHWILPPVYAYDDRQPEVMGMSPGGNFTICDNTLPDCMPIAMEEEIFPKECPDDCSGVGTCDLINGECNCEAGFTGQNCGQLEED